MKPLYEAMGLTVGISLPSSSREEKRKAYQSDIIYVTNNELGFDYLRDKMVVNSNDLVLPSLDFALIDEVDSILIDEARVPLIISGPKDTSLDLYLKLDSLVPQLFEATGKTRDHIGLEIVDETTGDFVLDRKEKTLALTDQGFEKVEKFLTEKELLGDGLSLYAPEQAGLLHHCLCALKSHHFFTRDKDYIVSGGQIVIIDEHTGRASVGRRWSDGLHQAIEAKENVSIQPETQTLASITFQNFFRLFDSLGGMTGTADTEAAELNEIYKLDVVVIPPNKPSKRKDFNDLVYVTSEAKYTALLQEIELLHKTGRPILIGTSVISQSEFVSSYLKKHKIAHHVLNAKQHEQEASIIAQAGRKGAVTIATNMAGRGTDIVLGGTYETFLQDQGLEPSESAKEKWLQRQKEVIELGGLAILACQRHESRRIDNQLRGRSGRQGDPGSSKFYISLEDHLMKIFMPESIRNMLARLQSDVSQPLPGDKMLSRKIEQVQRTIEGQHFEMRKHVLDFDDVSNAQRQVIYDCRDQILASDHSLNLFHDYLGQSIGTILQPYIPNDRKDQWLISDLKAFFKDTFDVSLEEEQIMEQDYLSIESYFTDKLQLSYQEKTQHLDALQLEKFQKTVILQTFDGLWREHLSSLDALKQNMGLQRFAQKDPKQQYKLEAFSLFQSLMENITLSITQTFLRVRFYSSEQIEEIKRREAEKVQRVDTAHQQELTSSTQLSKEKKVGRNEKCPCGSEKKYKYCCGVI
jgi:preprotein translocase subunit SecA